MDDYSKLAARLRRDGIEARDTHEWPECAPVVDPEDAIEAADALEAQAARIATLEELRNEYRRAITLLKEDSRARIAELEAENAKLKEYREMLGDQLQKEIMQTISLQETLHRAALKGENG